MTEYTNGVNEVITKEEAKRCILSYARLTLTESANDTKHFKCPYCNNIRSFSVDDRKGKFYCFSCKAKGDVFDLVQIGTGLLTFPDKLSYIESLINEGKILPGIDQNPKISENKADQEGKESTDNNLIDVQSNLSASWLQERQSALFENDKILNQLIYRGFTRETIRKAKIGYLPGKNEGDVSYPPSILIPFPHSTKMIYWNYYHNGQEHRKYIESKDSRKEIYNRSILKTSEQPIFIVEGVFDCLSILQCGFPSIALCGIGTNDLLNYLKKNRPNNNLILMLDNDVPGKEANDSLKKELYEEDIIYFESGILQYMSELIKKPIKDSNEALCKNKGLFTKLLQTTSDKASKMYEELSIKIKYAKERKKDS